MSNKLFFGLTSETLIFVVIAALLYVLKKKVKMILNTRTRRALNEVINEPVIGLKGVITEIMPNGFYLVETVFEHNKHVIKCHISHKCKKLCKTIKPNDSVGIEVSPYDLSKGRIVKLL
tara:strand:- start:50 stop:406 length:357 start_codon:yes stop_codon:yes gene_type:complete